MNDADWFFLLGLIVVAAPALLLAVVGVPTLCGRPLSESRLTQATQALVVAGLVAATAILVLMLWTGARRVPVELGHWVELPAEHFHFHAKLVFDRLSVPFVMLTYVLCGTIGAFASVYMHREPGFNRFFLLLAVFLTGMVTTSLSGTIEMLFAGWELVGLSSALLVAFFHERPAPVRNGLRVWSIYRLSDAALLLAALMLHHLTGEGEFDRLMGSGAWPAGQASLTSSQALLVGSLLVVAAAGKSALIPFSGWLPRAMEGPTPSSAVFYGALSVHLGAFLLLRVSPILELSRVLCAVVVVWGLATALLAAWSARVQTDIKSALAYSSLTQVGIIVAEIGAGLRYVALVHIIGHACLRTLQLLRAPSLLRDYSTLENALGELLPVGGPAARHWLPEKLRTALYRLALERGYLDALLADYVARPVLRLFRTCDRAERWWTDFLSGARSRESDAIVPQTDVLHEL